MKKQKTAEGTKIYSISDTKASIVRYSTPSGSPIGFSIDEEENNSVYAALYYLKEVFLSMQDIERIGLALVKYNTIGQSIFDLIANKSYDDTLDSPIEFFAELVKNPNHSITHQSILQIAAKHGWKMKNQYKDTYFRFAREFLSYKYDFRFNKAKHQLVYREKGSKEFKEFNDRVSNTIYQQIISEISIKISPKELETLLFSDFVQEIDPVADYFATLPSHDGHDYIKDLSETIVPDPQFAKIWPIYLKKWLLGLVAGVISDKDINQSALIIHGAQGLGKSRWISRLVPIELQDYYYTGKIIAGDKDSKILAYQNLIINLDELDFPDNKGLNSVKSLITQKLTQIRFPYDTFSVTVCKRSSFIGSVNRKEFLNDPTGNRRFLCITALKINADHNIDMQKVFAQAKHLLSIGEKHWFTSDENEEISKASLDFSHTTFEEDMILEKYLPCKHGDKDARYLNATEIMNELFPGKIDNGIRNRIGLVLTKHNFSNQSVYVKRIGQSLKKWILKNNHLYVGCSDNKTDMPF